MRDSAKGATQVWLSQLSKVTLSRSEVAPRGIKTSEIIGCNLDVSMRYPVVAVPERALGYNFMAAEALWVLSGSNSLDFNPHIRYKLEPYSDDGIVTFGAYGPPFIDQLSYVGKTLRKDPFSRQAIIIIWRQPKEPTKDVPCTVSMQFMIRDEVLHTNVFMRSSDVWLGLPYDMFTFSMMSMAVCFEVGVSQLGTLSMFFGSSHLYHSNFTKALEIVTKSAPYSVAMPWDPTNIGSMNRLMDILADIADSKNPGERLFNAGGK